MKKVLFVIVAILTISLNVYAGSEEKEWTVVGKWNGNHQNWSDTVTINEDGTFARSNGDSGKWTLQADNGRIILILKWNRWPAETLIMTEQNSFFQKNPLRFELNRKM